MARRTPPWPKYPEWTTSRYWTFLRSGLRSLSRKWPPIYQCLHDARRPYKGENKRKKWEYQCASCQEWFDAKSVAVDHRIPCGELNSYEDLPIFVERLFCGVDELDCLCHSCHDAKTKQEREDKKK